MTQRQTKKVKKADSTEESWILNLYVAGQSPKSMAAFINLKKICEEHLAGKARIKIVDLLKNPKLAKEGQIVAIPSAVRTSPSPQKTVIGDMSNTEKVLIGLNIRTIKEST